MSCYLLVHLMVIGGSVPDSQRRPRLVQRVGEPESGQNARQLYPDIKREDLTEEQRQTISALGTMAAGLAGGLTGDSSADAVAGAQAGKNAVENNNMFSVPAGIQQDTSLALWIAQQGGSPEEINQAIADSHLGPSAGVTYKMKPYVKGEAAVGAGYGFYVDGTIDPSQLSLNKGETLAVGGRAAGQVGVQFGPYFPTLLTMEKNNSLDFGLGIVGLGLVYGKDGIGLSIGVGPAIGWSGISKDTAVGNVDINGSSGNELYHYDFNEKGNK